MFHLDLTYIKEYLLFPNRTAFLRFNKWMNAFWDPFCHFSPESIWEEFQIIGWITITKVNESNFSQLEHFQLPLQSQVGGNERRTPKVGNISRIFLFMQFVKL